MADEFSFLTDSDDERAVEDVISHAMDHSVLEQIAAINCSSFPTTDNLPSHLESRFRKLKSLPATTAVPRFPPSKSKSLTPRSKSSDDSNEDETHKSVDFGRISDRTNASEILSPTDSPDKHSDEKEVRKSKSKPTVKSSSHTDSNSEVCKKSKSGNGSSRSRSDLWWSSESDTGSLSPPRRRIGCLWCSPKKEKSVPRKQGKENGVWCSSSLGSEFDAEFLKTFSIKEQKKIMKKAMKEEEKINREAEKTVKWAKQASARMMDVSAVDLNDQLSDLEK